VVSTPGTSPRSRHLVAVAVTCGLLLSGCAAATPSPTISSNAPAASATSQPASSDAALPSEASGRSIVVIGHSGATGYDSDPSQPGVDVRKNSWATGTAPAVKSVYQRMLAVDPGLEGNAQNFAIDGSDVVSLVEQARHAVEVTPAPELVLVQSIDNDMRCDGTDSENYGPYRTRLTETLDILTAGLPDARIFFVSQWANVTTYDRVAFGIRPDHLAGDGPCDTVDPATMQLDPAKEAHLQDLVDHYFGIITDTCARYPACRTDGGALQDMDLAPEDMSADLNHLSAAGHAKMAAIVFAALSASGN
jgi:lysophospholipase L1-like esterase